MTPFPAAATCAEFGSAIGVRIGEALGVGDGEALGSAVVAVAVAVGVVDGAAAVGAQAAVTKITKTRREHIRDSIFHWNTPRVRAVSENAYERPTS
jgi:hypothetical protein